MHLQWKVCTYMHHQYLKRIICDFDFFIFFFIKGRSFSQINLEIKLKIYVTVLVKGFGDVISFVNMWLFAPHWTVIQQYMIYFFSPTPEVFWLKNKADLPDHYEVSLGGQELTIPHLTEDDAGPYECYGTNTQGPRAFRNFVIRVECKKKRNWFPLLPFA